MATLTPTPEPDEFAWLTTREVAERYPVAAPTLHEMRGRRTHGRPGEQGPPFYKLGRSVVYLDADVSAWMKSKRVG